MHKYAHRTEVGGTPLVSVFRAMSHYKIKTTNKPAGFNLNFF